MTEREANSIVYESLLHTPGTRAEYFWIKATESKLRLATFCKEMVEAFKRINEYVNLSDGTWDAVTEEKHKHCINLDHITGGKVSGTLTRENIIEIEEPLNDFLQKVQETFKPTESKKKEIISFSWTGNKDLSEPLWQALKEAKCIHSKTDLKDFRAIFSDDLTQCKAVKWIASNKLIAYLFSELFECEFIEERNWQSIIEKGELFINSNGKELTAGDLATALNSITDKYKGLNPKGSEKIDVILKSLRP
ncbi:MAG: hypothetical protein H8E61_07170 [Bacteroidetes bacterium]|nr:hypothetical protein [Bacteroidota bacterium]